MMKSIEEIKKELVLNHPFPEKELDDLFALGEQIGFKPHTPIVPTGAMDRRVYLVREGIVRGVYAAKGREHTIYFAFPGDIIGSTFCLAMGEPAAITIEAVTRTVVTAIPMEEFFARAAESVHFAHWMIDWLLGQIYVIERKRIILTGDAAERYDGLVKRRPELIRSVPIKAIASYLGIAESSLSRLRNPKYRSVREDKE